MEETCKGCGGELDTIDIAMNALSRYGHGYICDDCGVREAFSGDFISNENN